MASGLSGCSAAVLANELPAGERLYDASPPPAGSESLWSTFKHEHYYRHTFATKLELITAVDNWMRFYSHQRKRGTGKRIRFADTAPLTTNGEFQRLLARATFSGGTPVLI